MNEKAGNDKGAGPADATVTSKKAEFFVLEIFFGKIAKVLVDYKNYGINVPKVYEGILSPQNLNSLSMVIMKYLQKEEINGEIEFASINDYINVNSKSTQVINNLIRGVTSHDDYNLTVDNLLCTLEESIKVEERYNCKLTVKDIINIQNFLIRNKQTFKILLRGADDPIYVMTNYLKDNYLDPNSFTFEMLNYKINLKINSK